MKKLLALLLIAGVVACADEPIAPDGAMLDLEAQMALGNGFPEGGHDYKLNLIGVPVGKEKKVAMDNNNGHRIFVLLESDNVVTNPGGKNTHLKKDGNNDQNQIYLCNSTDGLNDVNDARCEAWRLSNPGGFGVIDANATDPDGAIFGLPDPCADADPNTPCTPTYAIWARAHGPQNGGSAIITTCAEEWVSVAGADGVDVWCGSNGITLSKQSTRKAVDVTDNLLYMTIMVDETTDPQLAACVGDNKTGEEEETIYLFDDCFENYFWNYDNNGLKLLELRFYSG